jgi:hypothetical protein
MGAVNHCLRKNIGAGVAGFRIFTSLRPGRPKETARTVSEDVKNDVSSKISE